MKGNDVTKVKIYGMMGQLVKEIDTTVACRRLSFRLMVGLREHILFVAKVKVPFLRLN